MAKVEPSFPWILEQHLKNQIDQNPNKVTEATKPTLHQPGQLGIYQPLGLKAFEEILEYYAA